MQIVIDIPEELYKHIKNDRVYYLEDGEDLYAIVMNGTPLPKGHGRLIDADEVVSEATKGMKYPANHEYMNCVIAHVKLAPTIIEAESEEV